jgi:tetratricopeptide (TPR) repeat protein
MIPIDPETGTASATETFQIRGLLRQLQFAQAQSCAEALLVRSPEDREGLTLLAIAQRRQGHVEAALSTLKRLERLHPQFSRLHEERGQCFALLRKATTAIEAFEKAVTLNSALPASWHMLEGLYRIARRTEDAQRAADEIAILRSIPPEVVNATGLFLDGDLELAERMVRGFLLKHGNHVEAMRLLARIGIARGVFDDAELLLCAVLDLAPEYRAARVEYAEVLLELQKYTAARTEFERLIQEHPENARYFRGLYATACVGVGEHERAIALYRDTLRGTPDDADVYLSIAHALKTVGRSEEAIESYRRAADVRPGFGDAYWSLANLKTYRFTDEELDRLRELHTTAVSEVDRIHFCFALGKALEDRKEYAESYKYYEIGNALQRARSKYRPEIIETNTRLQVEVCTSRFFADRTGWGAKDPSPIFIVGLPRSGSTLIEQILASHSLVEGTQELPTVQQIVTLLRGREPDLDHPRYPQSLTELNSEDVLRLGERYLTTTRAFRSTAKPYFIDKMPNNFRHLGLIHLLLPGARVIDARREPMACCFSNFKQLFARGQEFTYSLQDIARYYRSYLELMGHWQRTLEGSVLRVLHEEVVEDLEGSVRRILEFCGLEFEAQCVEFHKTRRSVRTASSEQVRQPIYREGLDQWEHYEPWLAELNATLGDARSRYRTDP